MSQNTLYKRMREGGMLVKHDKGRNTTEIKIQNIRKKVINISSLYAEKSGGTGGTGGKGQNSNEERD